MRTRAVKVAALVVRTKAGYGRQPTLAAASARNGHQGHGPRGQDHAPSRGTLSLRALKLNSLGQPPALLSVQRKKEKPSNGPLLTCEASGSAAERVSRPLASSRRALAAVQPPAGGRM